MLIDTHCHLNDSAAFPDPDATIAEARDAGVERLIVIGVEPESCLRALALADDFEEVYAVVGWHPNYTTKYEPASLKGLEAWLSHPKALALGEIGLDFHWDYSPRDQQERALMDQLALARQIDKPVVFHCREAYPELLTILETQPTHPYLFHCFAGDAADAERAVALDCCFGVDGPITYKKADDLRAVVRGLPRDRIVVETDSPYLTPVPHRGKPNKPAYVALVNQGLAVALGQTGEETARLTGDNARRFFRF